MCEVIPIKNGIRITTKTGTIQMSSSAAMRVRDDLIKILEIIQKDDGTEFIQKMLGSSDPEVGISKRIVWEEYQKWCQKKNLISASPATFSRTVRKILQGESLSIRMDNKTFRIWSGIEWMDSGISGSLEWIKPSKRKKYGLWKLAESPL
jgi:hypothetical protein